MKESFAGVERRQSAAASPTKRIEPNIILESELTSDDKGSPQFFTVTFLEWKRVILAVRLISSQSASPISPSSHPSLSTSFHTKRSF
jgi:hypothetical protein